MVIDFSTFYELPRELNRLFDETFRPLAFSQRGVSYPLINLAEDESSFFVDVNIPGVDGADIDLTLTDKTLLIRGERKPEEGKYYRQERMGGVFQRIVSLPQPVERDGGSARFSNGILSVVLPKSDVVRPKKITIEA